MLVLLAGATVLPSSSWGGELEPIRLPPPLARLLNLVDREVILNPIIEKEFSWAPG